MDITQPIRLLSDDFGNPAFVLAVCGLLVFSAILVASLAQRSFSRLRRDARLALRALNAGASNPDTLSRELAELPASRLSERLKHDASTIREIDGRQYRIGFSSHQTYDDIIYEYIDTRTLEAWPNVFVGIGLLLTFIGLALSLWNASQGAASGDISVVRQSVTTLLEFSAVKFTTSLVALACSILLGIWIRSRRRAMDVLVGLVDEVMESYLPRLTLEVIELHKISPGYLAFRDQALANTIVNTLVNASENQRLYQTLEELREQALEQTAQLTAFNSDLAIQLSGVLDSKLQPMLAGLADLLETALRDMSGSLGQSNESALKSLLETFVGDLRGATASDSAEVQRNLQQLAEDLSRASAELSDRMTAVFNGMESTGDRFASVLGDASTLFRDQLGRVQSDIGSSLAGAMSALAATASQSSRESEALIDKLAAGATSFRATVEQGGTSFAGELDRGIRSIDDVVERLGQSVAQLGNIVDRTAAFAEASSERTGDRIGKLNETIAAVDRSFERVSQASETFTGAAQHVRGAVDLLRATQTAVQDKVAALQRAAESIASSSENLSGTLGRDIGKMSENLSSTTDRLTTAISAIAQESEAAGTRLSSAIGATLSEYEKRFQRIDGELQIGLTKILETFTAAYEEIQARVNELDHQFATSVNKLVSFNDRFGEHAEDITDAIAQLPKALSIR